MVDPGRVLQADLSRQCRQPGLYAPEIRTKRPFSSSTAEGTIQEAAVSLAVQTSHNAPGDRAETKHG